MLKKTITFHNLDGQPISEDFYFHLNKAEIAEMELSQKGGLSGYVDQIVKSEDAPTLIKLFKELILKTVGRRSEDGRRFIKNQDIIDDFTQTEAYSELFMELSTNHESAIAFMKGVLPAGMESQVEASAKTEDVKLPDDQIPAWIKEERLPTDAEMREATPEQLRIAYARKIAVRE